MFLAVAYGGNLGYAGILSASTLPHLPATILDTFSINKRRELSIPKVSIRQVKAARALLAWSQEVMALAADVSLPTVKRLEASDGPIGGRTDTVQKLKSALEKAGVEFIDENGGGPGVRIRKRQKPPKSK